MGDECSKNASKNASKNVSKKIEREYILNPSLFFLETFLDTQIYVFGSSILDAFSHVFLNAFWMRSWRSF